MARFVQTVTRRASFSAARRLASPALDAAGNAARFGRDAALHGHDFVLHVTVRGEVPEATGMVMDLKALGAILQERFVSRVDHRHLNRDVPFLLGVIPTAENMAVAVWREIEPELKAFEGCRLHRIRVYESRNNFVDYLGPTPAG